MKQIRKLDPCLLKVLVSLHCSGTNNQPNNKNIRMMLCAYEL